MVTVAWHVPVVAAENDAAEVPVVAKVTVGGVAVQPPSFRIVKILTVEGFWTGDVGAVKLFTAIS